jgi:polysaccharide export outer membrane protein
MVGLSGCAQPAGSSGQTASANPPTYRLGAGDRILVNVYGERDMTGEYEIDDTGVISVPLAGRVAVKDKTARELETGLEQQLSRGGLLNNPKVAVNVVRYRPFYILGEVQRPGAYPYYSGATVLNAVAQAGGYTYRARTNRASVVKAEGSQQTADENAYVQPGDVIIIPERWF